MTISRRSAIGALFSVATVAVLSSCSNPTFEDLTGTWIQSDARHGLTGSSTLSLHEDGSFSADSLPFRVSGSEVPTVLLENASGTWRLRKHFAGIVFSIDKTSPDYGSMSGLVMNYERADGVDYLRYYARDSDLGEYVEFVRG